MKNAGPYARLKFAMDYWCVPWFWLIDQADLLPSGSEFSNDLNLILVGTINTGKDQASIGYDQFYLTIKHSLNILLSLLKKFKFNSSGIDTDELHLLNISIISL